MPYCPKCGFQTDVDDNFCTRCGVEIKHRSEIVDNPDWIKNPKGKKQSFWNVTKQSFQHIFFDNDRKLSKNRKIINIIILVAILIVAVSFVTPYLDSIKLSIGDDGFLDGNGNCKYRLDATKISVSEAKFNESNLTMEIHLTNLKKEDVVIETLAKTYEFRFDNKGDTEMESVSMTIPAGKTLKLSFSVKKEPYILGLDFSNCEKLKINDWTVV